MLLPCSCIPHPFPLPPLCLLALPLLLASSTPSPPLCTSSPAPFSPPLFCSFVSFHYPSLPSSRTLFILPAFPLIIIISLAHISICSFRIRLSKCFIRSLFSFSPSLPVSPLPTLPQSHEEGHAQYTERQLWTWKDTLTHADGHVRYTNKG